MFLIFYFIFFLSVLHSPSKTIYGTPDCFRPFRNDSAKSLCGCLGASICSNGIRAVKQHLSGFTLFLSFISLGEMVSVFTSNVAQSFINFSLSPQFWINARASGKFTLVCSRHAVQVQLNSTRCKTTSRSMEICRFSWRTTIIIQFCGKQHSTDKRLPSYLWKLFRLSFNRKQKQLNWIKDQAKNSLVDSISILEKQFRSNLWSIWSGRRCDDELTTL